MVNRSKNLGTAAESKVVAFLNANGWPNAERRALRGIKDVGDITGIPGLIIEVKAGHAAWNASDNQVDLWLGETEVERSNASEHLGVLVVARRQRNVRDWWACLWLDQLVWLTTGASSGHFDDTRRTPVRTTLAHLVILLRSAGWGDPIESESRPASIDTIAGLYADQTSTKEDYR